MHSFSLKPRLACSSLLSRVKQAFLKHTSSPTSTGCLEDTSKHLSGILSPLCYGCSPCHAALPVFSPALLHALSLSLTTPLPRLSGCQSHVTRCFLTSNASSSTFKGCDIFFLCRGLQSSGPASDMISTQTIASSFLIYTTHPYGLSVRLRLLDEKDHSQ